MVLGFAMCVMTNIKYLIFLNIKIRAIWVTWALADLTKCFFKTIWRCLEKWSSKPKTAYSLGPFWFNIIGRAERLSLVIYTTSSSKSNEKPIRLVGKYRNPFVTWCFLFLIWSHMWSFPGGNPLYKPGAYLPVGQVSMPWLTSFFFN